MRTTTTTVTPDTASGMKVQKFSSTTTTPTTTATAMPYFEFTTPSTSSTTTYGMHEDEPTERFGDFNDFLMGLMSYPVQNESDMYTSTVANSTEVKAAFSEKMARFQLSTMDYFLLTSMFLNLILLILVVDLSILLIIKELELKVQARKENAPARLNNEA